MSYKVIVVGTDGSDRANVAVKAAFALGKSIGAVTHVAHVVPSAVDVGFSDNREGQNQLNELQAAADHIRSRVLDLAKAEGVEVEYHTTGGDDAADALMSLAGEVDAGLVVVGNRGMTGVQRLLGSVPNKISHHSPCDVLIVNTEAG